MPLVCPKWGDTSLWGDGDLWCGVSGSFQYVSYLRDHGRNTTTSWNLQSADDTVWVPGITTDGEVSFVSSLAATPSAVPIAPGPDEDVWRPAASDAGEITLTEEAESGLLSAALLDSSGIAWYWSVLTTNGEAVWATRRLTGEAVKLHDISVQIEYAGGDSFIIDRITALANIAAQQPHRFVSYVDFVSHKRLSIQVQYNGGDEFVVDSVNILAHVKKHMPKG